MSSYLSPSVSFPADPTHLKDTLFKAYGGKHYKSLPTPSLILKESVIDKNISQILNSISSVNERSKKKVGYRCHIKTHKTIEGVLKELGHNVKGYSGPTQDKIVVSTLREAYLIIDYQEKNKVEIVTDMVYGLPAITPDIIPELYEISQKIKNFHIFVDNLQHIEFLTQFNKEKGISYKWSAFVKIDMGTKRAGVADEVTLKEILRKMLSNKEDIEVYGFYAHAGHSYSSTSLEEGEAILLDEINSVNDSCKSLLEIEPNYPIDKLVISVGASPTARSFQQFKDSKLIDCIDSLLTNLELHAGNFMISDLQQLSTGTINEDNLAAFLLASVISVYPKRNNDLGEMLINAGALSFSKEVSHKFPGFGKLLKDSVYGDWVVDRLSQEHGILKPSNDSCTFAPIGEKLEILMQHACITLACFKFFFLIDDDGIIKDVWVPISGW